MAEAHRHADREPRQNGFQHIESCQREVEYRTGTEIVDAVLQNIIMLSHTFRQFFYRYGCLPEHYDMICRQVVKDLQRPDFVFTGTIYTFWAVNPH